VERNAITSESSGWFMLLYPSLSGSAMIHNFADRSGLVPGSFRIDPDQSWIDAWINPGLRLGSILTSSDP
jgi:hypothetical protein